MSRLSTNRDLYLAVNSLVEANAKSERSLEEYLRSLRQLALQFKEHESINLDDFVALLRDAFSVDPPEYDAALAEKFTEWTEEAGFAGWLETISSQIVDLHDMAESGDLQNDLRYFGLQSPRGSRWVNFDPFTYLECAMQGSVGGWEPGDESGRTFVPGPVGVLDNDTLVEMNPDDVPRPKFALPSITWDRFRDMLQSGQLHE